MDGAWTCLSGRWGLSWWRLVVALWLTATVGGVLATPSWSPADLEIMRCKDRNGVKPGPNTLTVSLTLHGLWGCCCYVFCRRRHKVRSIFQHGYDCYMRYAFPKDELLPLSCDGRDSWGGYVAEPGLRSALGHQH